MTEILSDFRSELFIIGIFFLAQLFHHNYIKKTLTVWLASQVDELANRGIDLRKIQTDIETQVRLQREHNSLTEDLTGEMKDQYKELTQSMTERRIAASTEHGEVMAGFKLLERKIDPRG